MKEVKDPSSLQRYVLENGTLTLDGLELLLRVTQALQEAQTDIAALDVRVTALEP